MPNRIPNDNCANCGKPFYRKPSQAGHTIHCSSECRKASAGPPTLQSPCLNCGKMTTVPRSRKKPRYCSTSCYNTHTKTKPDKICLVCGSAFRKGTSKQLYCSLKCAGVPQAKGENRICPQCGKEFYSHRTQDQKHCSLECQHKAMDTKITLVCLLCKKEFRVSPCYSIRKFCSVECARMSRPAYRNFGDKLRDERRTSIESTTEKALQEFGIPYIWEKRLGKYWVDFYLPAQKIAIECDEPVWHNAVKDTARDQWIKERYGIPVIRWTTNQIENDIRSLVQALLV